MPPDHQNRDELDLAAKRELGRQRRAKLKARKQAKTIGSVSGDATPIRIFPAAIKLPGADPEIVAPILIPDPIKGEIEGRRRRRKLVKRIQAAAGVATLLAYTDLMEANRGTPDRHARSVDAIAARTGLTLDYLERLGRPEMTEQGLGLEDYAGLVLMLFDLDAQLATGTDARVNACLAILELMTQMLNRAGFIIADADTASGINDDGKAGDRIAEGYNRGKTMLPILDLVRIAAFSNLNPAPIWIQTAKFWAPYFELARFAGRLALQKRVGRQATLDKSIFPYARWLLSGPEAMLDDQEDIDAVLLLRDLLAASIPLDTFADLLTFCEFGRQDLVVGEPRIDD